VPLGGGGADAIACGVMDNRDALDFIAHNHRAVLATSRSDGRPQLSLVAAGVDDDTVVVSTRETAVKAKNLRRRPWASLIVFTDNFYGNSVQVEGPVEVVSLPEAMEGLMAYYRGISGEHPDWDEYRAAMTQERRVLVRITVERAGPDHAG
jgi:PPOX class probable F420-dependent enzyme